MEEEEEEEGWEGPEDRFQLVTCEVGAGLGYRLGRHRPFVLSLQCEEEERKRTKDRCNNDSGTSGFVFMVDCSLKTIEELNLESSMDA